MNKQEVRLKVWCAMKTMGTIAVPVGLILTDSLVKCGGGIKMATTVLRPELLEPAIEGIKLIAEEVTKL